MKKSNIIIVGVAFATLIFQFATFNCSAQYTKLHDFDPQGGSNGNNPEGTSLISLGTFLYGMTTEGGTNNMGVLFKIKADGTGYSKLLDFAGTTNGSFPKGSLIYDGTFLYGMTHGGGSNNYGTIFKIKPDGTGYFKVLDFSYATGNGPPGSLIFDGTFLYGMTFYGTNSNGNIFKIKPDGTGYAVLLDFNGTANGKYPGGSLVSDGTFLYGMTTNGGTNNLGVIFKISPNGTGYVKLLDFAGITNGTSPRAGSLVSIGAFLYGMTFQGGTNNYGIVFRIKSDGTGDTTLLNFSGNANGQYPQGSLISDGTFLYGMTDGNGTNSYGNVFKIKTDGTGYADLLQFNGSANGSLPWGSLISDGTFLYGMTYGGGTNNHGTVFKFNPYCSAITFTQAPTICAGHNITIGTNTYNISGTYTDVLRAVSTCDSIVTTNLMIDSINTTVLDSNTTLTAIATNATYQWINCIGNTPIVGQTNQSYKATANGNYAVILTHNSCSDTSACHNITTAGILENTFASTINIYPNPFTSQTSINFGKEQKNTIIKIIDMLGKEVRSIDFSGKQLIIEKEEMKEGIYFLQIIDDNKNLVNRILITQ